MREVYALLVLLFAVSAHEEEYSIERDDSSMARLARDFLPHIKTRDQLREMEVQLMNNMNEYFDRVIKRSKTYMLEHDLDPMRLPDFSKSFSHKVLWITWHGEFVLDNGRLQGLTTVFRSGDCGMQYQDGELIVRGDIGFKVLKLGYDWRAKFMGIGPSGYVGGTDYYIKVNTKIRVNFHTKNATMDYFHVEEYGLITVKVTGLGIRIDWLLDIIADIVLNVARGVVKNLLDDKVGQVLKDVVSKMDIGSFLPPYSA